MKYGLKLVADDRSLPIVRGDDIVDPTGRRLSISDIREIVSDTPVQIDLVAEQLADCATPETVTSIKLMLASLMAVSDSLDMAGQALAAMTIRSQRVELHDEWAELTYEEQAVYDHVKATFFRERLKV